MNRIDEILEEYRKRGLLILQDDLDQSNRSVIVSPAANITSAAVNEVITLSRGLLLVAISKRRAADLGLESMERLRLLDSKTSAKGERRRLLESVECRDGVTTGISAGDRAQTISALVACDKSRRDLVRPGHIFPCEVSEGGVLQACNLAEGSFDVVRLCSENEGALFADLLDSNGEFLDSKGQSALADKNNIPILQLSQLVRYRLIKEPMVSVIHEEIISNHPEAPARLMLFASKYDEQPHHAVIFGNHDWSKPVLVRVQQRNLFGHLFSDDLQDATFRNIIERLRLENGVLIQLSSNRHEAMVDRMRSYGIGAQILSNIGAKEIIIITSSPKKLHGLEAFGLVIAGQQSASFPERASA